MSPSVAVSLSALGCYNISAAGPRFLTVGPAVGADAAPTKIHVVENWYEGIPSHE